MDKAAQLQLIAALSQAKGAPGFEDEVLEVLRKYAGGLGTFTEDRMRNLFLHRTGNTGNRPTVLLDAHTDEVGFMVQSIQPNGLLKFIPLGGWVNSNIPAHRVQVRVANGSYIPGVVASKPPHFMGEAERKAAPTIEAMLIDVGASSRKEAEEVFGVRIGEPVVPEATFEKVPQNDTFIGKAFDCRLGCAALLATLQQVKGEQLPLDVVAGFATQEELGLRGARVTVNTIQPDIAIVFEAAPADDNFAPDGQCALKKGPMLRHVDSTILTNPRYLRFVLELAEKLNIDVQQAVRSGGGTNAGAIHLAGQGIPVVVLAIPTRYIHTHYGIAAWQDYSETVKLATALLKALTPEVLQGF